MNFKFIPEPRLGSNACWLVCLVALLLVMGCKSEDQERQEQHQTSVNPEHGNIVEVNGETFQIAHIGGVRFRFPYTNTFVVRPSIAYLHLNWPDIPPGKAQKTKFTAIDGKIGRTNSIEVQITANNEPIVIDKNKSVEERWRLNASDYIVRDDLKLGLKTFVSKTTAKNLIDMGVVDYAYSLTDDAIEPWGGQPIVVSGEFISFMYAPEVSVRIVMMGWTGHINPDWKGIYLGVVETLNKYREDKL